MHFQKYFQQADEEYFFSSFNQQFTEWRTLEQRFFSMENFLTPEQRGTSSNHDFATIQYNKSGLLRWIQIFDGPANADDYATALAIDKQDNIYVTGASSGIGTNLDYVSIKYTLIGKFEWAQRYNNKATNGIDQSNDIAVDDNQNIYVTGMSQGTATNFDFATIKYRPQTAGQTLGILNQNKQILKQNLDLIARSVTKLVNDTAFVNAVAQEIIQSGYHEVTFQTLIQKYATQSINLKQKLADSLASCGATAQEIQNLKDAVDSFSIGKGMFFTPRIVFPTMDTITIFDASQSGGWDGKTPCRVAVSLLNMNGQTVPTYRPVNNQCTVQELAKSTVLKTPIWHISLIPSFQFERIRNGQRTPLANFFRQIETCSCGGPVPNGFCSSGKSGCLDADPAEGCDAPCINNPARIVIIPCP